MSVSPFAVGRQISNDPFIRSLGLVTLSVPAIAALAIGLAAVSKPRAPKPAQAVVGQIDAQAGKPVLTSVISRPRASALAEARLQAAATISPVAQIALALAPPENVPRATQRPEREGPAPDYTPTSAMPDASPARRFDRIATLRTVRVADGLRLIGDGAAFELAGVAPLTPDAMCRRIDGVQQNCNQRATDRLEILTRGRVVTCRAIPGPANATARAACVAGKIDLAEDLVKNGLARRG